MTLTDNVDLVLACLLGHNFVYAYETHAEKVCIIQIALSLHVCYASM